MTRLQATGIIASYDGRRVVDQVDLRLEGEQIHAILGPSGCGKSTLLRCLAGLKAPEAGRVLLDGEDVSALPPERRQIVLLHQENTLFPHLDVRDNVLFGPRARGEPAAGLRARADQLLELVRLPGFGDRRVTQLSGGERQRVALARALATRPKVILLDEPMSHLDAPLRVALRAEMRTILRAAGATALYVTHDREEAFALADHLLLMDDGRFVDDGPPPRVHDRPVSPHAARLLGHRNVVAVRRDGDRSRTSLGPIAQDVPDPSHALYREEELRVRAEGPGVAVTVERWEYVGGAFRVSVRLGGDTVHALQPAVEGLVVGSKAHLDATLATPLVWGAPVGPEADII